MADMIPLPRTNHGMHQGDRRTRGGGGYGGRGRGRHGGRGNRNGWHGGRRGGRGRGGRGRGRGRGGGRHQEHNVEYDPVEVIGEPSSTSVTIAVEGCCHGELDSIYDRLKLHEERTGQKIDLLLCCGDFQSIRNPSDFHSSSIPQKFRKLGTFPKYYAGEKQAPILTIFIGGNHEASQPLQEFFYGGWVAPNIYYMGAAGVIRYGGLRIGGLSGIYKSHDYNMGHFETPPLDNSTLRSIYHVRNVDVYRLKCLSGSKEPLDIMLSHDWPQGIEQHGDTRELLRKKPFFAEEVEQNTLGNPANREILDLVRPKLWFSAHLHVKFKATLKHVLQSTSESASLPALIPSQIPREKLAKKLPKNDQDSSEDSKESREGAHPVVQEPTTPSNQSREQIETKFHGLESDNKCGLPDLTEQMTQFLALDKCLPRRNYLSIIHVEGSTPKDEQVLEYDPEWLAILRKTHHLTCTEKRRVHIPEQLDQLETGEVEWVKDRIKLQTQEQGMTIPRNFTQTVRAYTDSIFRQGNPILPRMGNPQTDALLALLELEHKVTIPFDAQQMSSFVSQGVSCGGHDTNKDKNEIDIDEVSIENEDANEIDIDDISQGSPTAGEDSALKETAIKISEGGECGTETANAGERDVSHGQEILTETGKTANGSDPEQIQRDANEDDISGIDKNKDTSENAANVGQDDNEDNLPAKKPRCNS